MTVLRSNSPWIWAPLLLIALTVRLVAGQWWQSRLPEGTKFRFGDSESYWLLGQAIAQGKPYQYGPLRIFRTPGYPVILAGLFKLVGDGRNPAREPNVLWGRALSAILGVLAVGGVAGLAWSLFGPKGALAAAAIAALYPEAIALSVFILSEAPFCSLMLLQLIAWARAWQAKSARQQISWSALGGVAAGLATLMRPSWLLFTPFAFAIGLTFYSDRKKQLLVAAVMLLGLAVTMSPWWIRNYQVAGRFVPTTLQVGASLYDGLSPKADGSSEMSFVAGFLREQQREDQWALAMGQQQPGIFEDRLDRRMFEASAQWARQNPRRVLELAGIKFLRMWSPVPNAAEFGSTPLRLLLAVTYLPVLILAGVGLWRFARRDWPYFLCAVPAIYFTALHCIFVSSLRYRQPAMLALIVLAAGVIVALMETTKDARSS